MVKVCKRCNQENIHYVLKSGKPYSWCKLCVNAYNLKQYHKHKPAHQARMVKANLKRKYNLDIDTYKQMLANQHNQCLICWEELVLTALDHCHKTGRVRGILCSKCNSGLGMFRDNPDLLQAAAAYLVQHGSNRG